MPAVAPDRSEITGLILAGGRGERMGGLDKGWVEVQGRPLIETVVERFAPQVGTLLISANRNLQRYGALGIVVTDHDAGVAAEEFPGPLIGLLAGMRRARSAWLAIAPCDAPLLPLDLVARLAAAAGAGNAEAALARVDGRLQPVFALVATRLQAALADAVADRQRALHAWFASVGAHPVDFPDDAAFRNVNSSEARAG